MSLPPNRSGYSRLRGNRAYNPGRITTPTLYDVELTVLVTMKNIKISSDMRKWFEAFAAEGGKASAASMTPEQRLERAKKAGKASGIARAKKKADREAQ